MKRNAIAGAIILTLAIGIAVGFGIASLRGTPLQGVSTPHDAPLPAATASVSAAAERKVLYWYDPMYPQQKFDKPGKSPYMDMDLLPKYADDEAGGVRVDPRVVQSLGVRFATVTRESVAGGIAAVATVGFNERDIAVVQARSGGFVERVYARAPGDIVAANAPLVDVLLPDWTGAQQEFLAVKATGDAGLTQAARQRLRLLGMPEPLIQLVENTGSPHAIVTIAAPIGGVIQELGVRAGMSVAPGMTLAKINGLGTVWLEAAVPEIHAAQLQPGRAVAATFAAYPGETFKGRIAAVLPEASRDTRTLRVRMELPNRGTRLKPGMFGQVAIAAKPEVALAVPSEAVVRTGTRAIVFVAEDSGRFRPVEVTLGREVDGKLVVLQGLDEGQRIVASGQFLIDSEASLRGIVGEMSPGTASSRDAAAGAQVAQASGNVVEIGKDGITIAHGAVPALDWPPMTMTFELRDTKAVAALRAGDAVRFTFQKTTNGYEIVSLSKERARS
ncbi:MAG TPA: efflux RND transporter periplasmic adaptor subunit [Casimicrobiaceae bacterium]|nr:efflux RND transporter periplasmic adaptor subunit [Casimicrobiaceae bacterium]